MCGYDGSAEYEFGLKGSGGADAHHSECAVMILYLAGVEVDVGERVELVDHDVDIVGPYAMTQAHDGLSFVCSAYCVELAG